MSVCVSGKASLIAEAQADLVYMRLVGKDTAWARRTHMVANVVMVTEPALFGGHESRIDKMRERDSYLSIKTDSRGKRLVRLCPNNLPSSTSKACF